MKNSGLIRLNDRLFDLPAVNKQY